MQQTYKNIFRTKYIGVLKIVLLVNSIQYKQLETDGNTNLCCPGFVLALFQSTTANKIDSEHTQDYTKLFPVCKVEI